MMPGSYLHTSIRTYNNIVYEKKKHGKPCFTWEDSLISEIDSLNFEHITKRRLGLKG